MEGVVANLRMKRKAAAVRDGVGGFGSSSQGGSMSPEPYVDAFNRRSQPSSRDLLRELKNTVYACVKINAFTCASFPPIVYYKTSPGLPMPKSISGGEPMTYLKKKSQNKRWWPIITKGSPDQMALPFHPIMDLFQRGNWRHSGINLWYVTHQFLEVFGCAYWWVKKDENPYSLTFGLPAEIRILPTQDVECKYETSAYGAGDDPFQQTKPSYYLYTMGVGYRHRQIPIAPEDVIEFHTDDLNNIYEGGRSPLHGGYEYAVLQGEYIAHRLALYKNRARPDFIVSPGNNEYLGPDERARLQKEWMQTFRRGGVGLPHFAATPLNVQVLQALESQVTLLAEHGATKEDILNSFGVPVSYFTRETNMANLAASRELHTSLTIRPANHGRDEVLTKRLCPYYDMTGALFCSSEDPVPEDEEAKARRQAEDLKSGVRSINEVRAENGMPPVEWGELPWMPTYMAPADMQLIWEERQRIAEASNDPADEVESVRTRERPEDKNDPDRPMSEYGHAAVHTGMKEKKKPKKEKDDGETKKKAYDEQPPVTNVWNLPPQPPPHITNEPLSLDGLVAAMGGLKEMVEKIAERPIIIDGKADMTPVSKAIEEMSRSVTELAQRPVEFKPNILPAPVTPPPTPPPEKPKRRSRKIIVKQVDENTSEATIED